MVDSRQQPYLVFCLQDWLSRAAVRKMAGNSVPSSMIWRLEVLVRV